MAKRGRVKTYAKKINVVEALQNLADVSYPLRRQLRDMGYLAVEPNMEVNANVRGRKPLIYSVTGKGRSLIGASKAWAKPKATA